MNAVALLALLALSIVANLATVVAFVRYIDSRDQREAAERQQWANRVQAPEVAVAQTVPAKRTTPGYVSLDDDEGWHQAREVERALQE